MRDRRKFSIFISSAYEDLKEERQALVGVVWLQQIVSRF